MRQVLEYTARYACRLSHRLVCFSFDWLCFIPTSNLQERQRPRSIGLGAADMHNGHAAICSSHGATTALHHPPTHMCILCQITRWCAVALALVFIFLFLFCFIQFSQVNCRGKENRISLPVDETDSCVCEVSRKE